MGIGTVTDLKICRFANLKMSLSLINTADPIALRYLMTETIFGVATDGMTKATVETRPEASEPESARIPSPPPQFSFYGKNKRHYLFLTEDKQHEWMSEPAMGAFIKTLAALRLTTDDVAVLNVAKLAELPSIDDLSLFFSPKVVICLGVAVGAAEQEGLTVIDTYSFDEMLTDAEKKRLFWTTIKPLLV